MCAVQAICTLQILVSTALLAKALTTYQKETMKVAVTRFGIVTVKTSLCDTWDETRKLHEYDHKCSQITGGVVSQEPLLNYYY